MVGDPLAPVEGLDGARREQHLELGTAKRCRML
jgi:hypothetical protein